jgi:apolipoprotein D and lipocalin family protein
MRKTFAFLPLAALLSACAGTPATMAPQPAKPIDAATFYTGTWYEIGRTPVSVTTNCMAGTTEFYRLPNTQLMERDACHKGSPEGKERVFRGYVLINNPENTKITVHYLLWGVIPFTQRYWMLDHDPAQTWFIVSDPHFTHVDILSRNPRPTPVQISAWTAEVAALGYDPANLEFPQLSAPGETGP